MIDIGVNRSNLGDVADEWREKLDDFLFDNRSNKVWVRDGKKRVSGHDTYSEKMMGTIEYREKQNLLNARESQWVKRELAYFCKNFNKIVKADEVELKRQAKNYVRRAKKTTNRGRSGYKALMERLYIDFTQSDSGSSVSMSHYFFNMLNVRTCPYCNRQYTFTLDEKTAKMAPEYDHFYDKATYPILAVSFYNLVPSCHNCNHIKSNKKTVKVNPFFRGFESKFYLYDKNDPQKRLNALEMLSKGDGRLELRKDDGGVSNTDKGNIKSFGLKGLYSMHNDYVKDILEKAASYDNTLLQLLADEFQKRGHSPDHVFSFVWGKYLDETQYENRPLSKLTRDLLEQLEIIEE